MTIDDNGAESVHAVAAKTAIAEAIADVVRGFELARPFLWVRDLSEEHRAVIKIDSLKGAQYDVVYGISCRWVPHLAGGRYSWHRTVKQARLDLWVDHFSEQVKPRRWISAGRGSSTLQADAAVMTRQVSERAPLWWATVADLPGVLAEARRQADIRYNIHSPRPGFVAAFTLARLGDLVGAKAELVTRGGLDEPELARATTLLAAVVNREDDRH